MKERNQKSEKSSGVSGPMLGYVIGLDCSSGKPILLDISVDGNWTIGVKR